MHEAWAWETAPEANVYAWILSVIHGFRMPLFFLLSGFFTALLWQSRGLQRLWGHRLRRLGLPLLAGMFTVVPAIVWLEAGRPASHRSTGRWRGWAGCTISGSCGICCCWRRRSSSPSGWG